MSSSHFYVILAAWRAQTTYPWANEAWFASPALNLAQKGFMGTTILESKGTWMEGMDRHTYWILPLHILAQTAWYKLFGFSLLTMRWLSICWGAVILLAWYALMLQLSRDHRVALLTVGLIAVDDHFISVAALGRMDAMCAGLGWAGCAAFICLRERWFHWAIFAGNALVAASCFTHPCGALYFVVLSAITIYYDRRAARMAGSGARRHALPGRIGRLGPLYPAKSRPVLEPVQRERFRDCVRVHGVHPLGRT